MSSVAFDKKLCNRFEFYLIVLWCLSWSNTLSNEEEILKKQLFLCLEHPLVPSPSVVFIRRRKDSSVRFYAFLDRIKKLCGYFEFRSICFFNFFSILRARFWSESGKILKKCMDVLSIVINTQLCAAFECCLVCLLKTILAKPEWTLRAKCSTYKYET